MLSWVLKKIFTPNFFSPKIFLQWAVGEARCDTMLPSILVGFFSLRFCDKEQHNNSWNLSFGHMHKLCRKWTKKKMKRKISRMAISNLVLLEHCKLAVYIWFDKINAGYLFEILSQLNISPRAQWKRLQWVHLLFLTIAKFINFSHHQFWTVPLFKKLWQHKIR